MFRFFFKNSYAEDTFESVKIINTRRNAKTKPEIQKLYKKKLGIPEKKKQGIMSLIEKNIIPEYYHDFYINL